jgi:hypothetical protein
MLVYPDKNSVGSGQSAPDGYRDGSRLPIAIGTVLRMIALIIAFISVFGFFFKILFF